MSKFLVGGIGRIIVGIFALSVFAINMVQAQEQDSDQAENPEQVLEEVMVTGSLVKRDNANSQAPIEIVNRDQFSAAGYGNIIDVAKDLTANSGSVLVQDTGTLAGTAQITEIINCPDAAFAPLLRWRHFQDY